MRLLDLLKSAAGEAAILTRLGRWRLAVSSLLDALSDPAYIEVRRATSDQTVDFTAEDDVICNAVVTASTDALGNSRIGYDTATGVFTLNEAGLYELEFFGAWVNFGTPNVTAATAEWTDGAGTPLYTGLLTWVRSSTSTANDGSQPTAKALYRAAAGAQVKVRASGSGGGGTADLQRGSSFATVRRVA